MTSPWFSRRVVVVAVTGVVLLGAAVFLWSRQAGSPLSWSASGPVMLTTPEDVARYQGHRYLISVFDSTTHELKGHADRMVRPGESAQWEVAGVAFAAEFRGMTRQKVVSRGEVVEEYDAVAYRFRCGNTIVEGAHSIIRPSVRPYRGAARGRDAVVLEIPIGPAPAEPLSEILPQKFDGTAMEIERLLLALVPRWKFLYFASADSLISMYQILGKTQRAEQWTALLRGDDPRLRISAAAVLTLAGNQEATAVFCQEARANVLATMPRSEPILRRMVELIVQDGPLEPLDTGLGLPRLDMRHYLIKAIARKYTKEDLRPYAPQLMRWIEDDSAPWGKQWASDLRKAIDGRVGDRPDGPTT